MTKKLFTMLMRNFDKQLNFATPIAYHENLQNVTVLDAGDY